MLFAKFDGDVVQAVQALKESCPEPNPKLLDSVKGLVAGLGDCRRYCADLQPSLPFPFVRATRQVYDVLVVLFPEYAATANGTKKLELAIPIKTVEKHAMETFQLGAFDVPRLFNGLWQLSSPSWGSGTAQSQEEALLRAVEYGLTATDMADHYVSIIAPS
ncbi:hypothetical protein PC116_g28953 [Phytophthora cactorum]|nr:hypothetical protein PC116_g28953 [Phytophthora cactorum]